MGVWRRLSLMDSDKTEVSTLNYSWVVYLIGIFLFGLFYEQIKTALGGGILFVIVALGYLLVLRFVGDYLSKKWLEHKKT